MGVRSLSGLAVVGAMSILGLGGCGGGRVSGGAGNPDTSDTLDTDEPAEEVEEVTVPGQPTVRTAKAIHEACMLFAGPATQVNLTDNPAGGPLLAASTNYHVITAASPAGWAGFFNLTTDGGDVVFSIDTSVVTPDLPEGAPTPSTPIFVITSGGAQVTPRESVTAPLECEAVVGAYRYRLQSGDHSVSVSPTAWYQFGLVVTKTE